MSDSDQLSAESSLSLFSGLGTSSISGGSDFGAIKVEELSDKKLEALLDENQNALKLLILETLMFESFHERLITGQISLSPSARTGPAGGPGSRKGSGTLSGGGDTISDSDSLPATTGTSLLDVSHRSHLSSRKRSSSRTSMGSRGKSLRLTEEQKCGIATKEYERIGSEVSEFRATARKETLDGMAEIAEMTIRLQELHKAKADLTKRIRHAKIKRSSHYDFEKLEDCFQREVLGMKKHKDKLTTKNGVLVNSIRKLQARIRSEKATSLESGPVNIEQLQLENNNISSELAAKNKTVMAKRRTLIQIKRNKTTLSDQIKAKERLKRRLRSETEQLQREIELLKASIPNLEQKTLQLDEQNQKLIKALDKYESPSADEYLELKLKELKLNELAKTKERKLYLSHLEQAVAKQKRVRAKKKRAQSALPRYSRPGQHQVIKGRTFNIEFKTEDSA